MNNIEGFDPLLDQQIEAARQRAAIADVTEPRAESAYYDSESGRVVIHLRHGAIFSFPAKLAQGLADATSADLAEVVLTPSGSGLHWEKLDADLSIPSLLQGIYGNSAWMEKVRQHQRQTV